MLEAVQVEGGKVVRAPSTVRVVDGAVLERGDSAVVANAEKPDKARGVRVNVTGSWLRGLVLGVPQPLLSHSGQKTAYSLEDCLSKSAVSVLFDDF